MLATAGCRRSYRARGWLAGCWPGLVLAGAAVLSPAPAPAWAWGDEGHRIIALVAYAHLTSGARDKVDAILRDDTDTLTEPDIASRATWADKYRDSDRNTSEQRYRLTRAWHFVDLKFGGPDLVTARFDHSPAGEGATDALVFFARLCSSPKRVRWYDIEYNHTNRQPALRNHRLQFQF